MEDDIKTNDKYRDRLFRMVFGREDTKDNILSLYNALNNTDYDDVNDVEINTIEDVIYIKMKNDVSFLIDSCMSLWEQQSSVNPNMPLRGLMYFGKLYDAYVTKNEFNIYGSRLIKIPTPQYIVFYNGVQNVEPVTKLRLSDAFIDENVDHEFEWTATMYNLNKGNNDELLGKCKPLSDYMTFVDYVQEELEKDIPKEDAIDSAVKRCINENIMADFLTKHRSEVIDVCITEFNEKVFVRDIREESQNELVKAIELLRAGKSSEEIAKTGIDQKTIDLALAIK